VLYGKFSKKIENMDLFLKKVTLVLLAHEGKRAPPKGRRGRFDNFLHLHYYYLVGSEDSMNDRVSAETNWNAIIGASRAILQKKTFAESARAIFDFCRELTGAVSGYVALLNEKGDENEVLFLEAGGMPCTVDPLLPMPIRGLRAKAYQTHAVVYDNDFMRSPWVDFMPAGHVELRNVLFAPLNLEGATVGIIGLANKPGDFNDEDAGIASVFGELAAIALRVSRQMDLLNERADSLESALSQVRTLHGLLPICSGCKKIRDDEGYWTKVESYISSRTDAQFSHGLCPECLKTLYPEYPMKKDKAPPGKK